MVRRGSCSLLPTWVARAVFDILDQLLQVDVLKDLTLDFRIYENFGKLVMNSFILTPIRDIPNSLAYPDDRLLINTGMLLQCQTADQVACVLNHEIGHLLARHPLETGRAHQIHTYISTLNVSSSGEHPRTAHVAAYKQAIRAPKLPDSQLFALKRFTELEADIMSLMIMADAGFDPQSCLNFLEGLQAWSLGPSKGAERPSEEIFSHPHVGCAMPPKCRSC